MTVFIYDKNNFFIKPLLIELVEDGMRYTEVSPLSNGLTGSMPFKPVFDETNQIWSEGATQEEIDAWNEVNNKPSEPNEMEVLNEQVVALEKENKLLKAQVEVLSQTADFHEELIAEMAMQVYA